MFLDIVSEVYKWNWIRVGLDYIYYTQLECVYKCSVNSKDPLMFKVILIYPTILHEVNL